MRRGLLLVVVAITGNGDSRGVAAEVAIAWNDFRADSGMLGAISASAPWAVTRDPIPIGLDSVLESAFGKLFVLSAGDGTLRVVDPVSWTVERTYALDADDDPVDIEVVSPQLAYVTRRNAKQLLQLDLFSGTMQDSVDLGIFADSDGIPDLGTMVEHDGRLFIQVQRLNFDEPSLPSQPSLAVMDLETEQLIDVDPARDGVQAIELEGTFPKFKMQVVGSTRKLFVSATGAFFDQGGVEVIDLDDLRTEGLLIREADDFTGADLGAFVMVSSDSGFLAYSTDLLLSSHLHQFSLTDGVNPTELAVALDYFAPVIEFDPGTNAIFFPIGGSLENGVHVFDAASGARLNDTLIPTSGPPTDLIVLTVVPEPRVFLLAAIGWIAVATAAARWRRYPSDELKIVK